MRFFTAYIKLAPRSLSRLAMQTPRIHCRWSSITQNLFKAVIDNVTIAGGDVVMNGATAGTLLDAYLGYAKFGSHWTLSVT
jgi:hypothetical protein